MKKKVNESKKITKVLESIDISKKDESTAISDLLKYQAFNIMAATIPESVKLYKPNNEAGITLGNVDAVIARVTKDIASLKNIYLQLKSQGVK